MKSKFTLVLSLFLTFSAFAQNVNTMNDGRIGYKTNEPVEVKGFRKSNQSFGKANSISGWYFYYSGIYTYALNKNALQPFVSFIFPDTNVIALDDGDTARYWPQLHSYGQVIDPKDEIFDFQDPPVPSTGSYVRFANKDSYTVDSLAFRYLYIRNIEEQDLGGGAQPVVDTLFVEFYKGKGGQQNSATYGLESSWYFVPTGSSDTNRFSRPNYNLATQSGTAVVKRETILLTLADTTGVTADEDNGWSTTYYGMPVGITLNAGEILGYAVYFKPGSVYSVGDTILATGPKKPSKRTANYFGLYYVDNDGTANEQIPQTKYFNNMYWIISKWIFDIPSDQTRGALEYGFIPGTLYDNAKYLLSQFHITGNSTLRAEELQKDFALGMPYPNPVTAGNAITVEYKANKGGDVAIEVYDVLGKQVKTLTNTSNVGVNNVEISTAGMQTGMYIINLKVAGETVASKKFNVVR